MEALADDALALLDALSIPQAIVGGVSMGGYVAIALARRDPGRVKALVLIDTQASADDEAGRARREAVAREVEEKGLGPLAEAMLPKLLAPATSADVKARVDRMMRAQSPAATAAASRGMATRTDGRDLLSRFGGPCLIVVGEHDVVTPVDKAKAMAALVPQARLEIVPGAGHLPNLEQPEAFARALGAFLGSA
jgi:pimeloyl-ACP methyl ester carboxylesterase